jgi:hypothetical protein
MRLDADSVTRREPRAVSAIIDADRSFTGISGTGRATFVGSRARELGADRVCIAEQAAQSADIEDDTLCAIALDSR